MIPPEPRLNRSSRRRFLGSALAAGVVLAAESAPLIAFAAGPDITVGIEGGITLTGSPGGRLTIRDGQGTIRSIGSKFEVKNKVDDTSVAYSSIGGTPTLERRPDGTEAIRMAYTFAAAAGTTAVVGWFSVSNGHAVLEWHVTGPDTLIPDGFSFSRSIQGGTEPDDYIAVTEWVRDTRGGIPYEATVGVAHTSTWGTKHGFFLLDRSKQAWTNLTWVHAPGVAQPGGWISRADFYFTETRPSPNATIGHGDELGLELTTNAAFNVYDAPGAPMKITALVANGGKAAKSVQLQLLVRDFDGVQLASSTVPGDVTAGGTWQHTFTVPAPAAGIALAEVVVRSGGDEAFARTNLATLPPYNYQAGANSMFGMANYPWLLRPNATAVLDLWQRIGVSLVRIAYDGGPGLKPADYDARGIRHNIELQPTSYLDDNFNSGKWATDNLKLAVDSGAMYFEVGNELNKPFNEGTAAAAYLTKVMRPVFNERAATGANIKLMNNGLAGMDKPWVDNFIAGGGWDLIDAFAYHPGRGNFTPDYVPPPGGDAGATGTYWNFAGGLKQLKALMAQHGQKEIWLTEAYAPTRPNSWWADTYRHAAENVLLTLAISKAEGIKCVCWYQANDSIFGMPQLADPLNTEYHFGLLNRDLSPKPSLLAYATAARTLDQATFRGRLTFANPKTFGLWFDTPTGPVTVLWNRADGYILNTVGQRTEWHFPAPETWVDPWPTKTALTVAATGAVRQVDSIGRTKNLSPSNGRVNLTLDGAPRIYHGLTPQTLQGVHRLRTC
ncbi:hypothetical protein OG474_42885 [Kribbella sp. NBC_01505]|uniref:hypothetical protein n=1 Tax=Kribbella sp. NBC_01505 TaxID=2903580 RepID=UPI00386F9D7B